MDDRGYWHNVPREESITQKLADELGRGGPRGNDRPRYALSVDIGEMVSVRKDDGQCVMAVFESADRNRVTLSPKDDGNPRPYLELAERVTLERANGQSAKAQVWDNRKGKLILRTLPVFE